MGELIDGVAIAAKVRDEVKARAAAFAQEHGRAPGLHVVLVGDDPASQVYVRNKEKAAAAVGIAGEVHRLPGTTTQAELLRVVDALNRDEAIDGILVQLPLPKHLDELAVVDAIDPAKDVDGLTPISAGLLVAGRPGLRPCTPTGCMRMLDEVSCDPKGKRAVVIGRSILVGKPMALMLLERHATVTIAHSRTADLPALVRDADIVIAAVGRPHLVKGDFIKPGAVVIDVGMNRLDDGKLTGDVDFEAAKARASFITPVPKGVGPMTIAYLLENTVTAAERRAGGA
jgi:methylenetetrahydrofolate dehydrogenase (NADP+)/methenyltetrahydrofolate cyclohydrolase